MLSQYCLIIALIDVIAKNCGRSYCQVFGQMLLPLLFEVVIPHFLADVGPILLNSVLADVVTKIYGRSYCQNYYGQMLLL